MASAESLQESNSDKIEKIFLLGGSAQKIIAIETVKKRVEQAEELLEYAMSYSRAHRIIVEAFVKNTVIRLYAMVCPWSWFSGILPMTILMDAAGTCLFR